MEGSLTTLLVRICSLTCPHTNECLDRCNRCHFGRIPRSCVSFQYASQYASLIFKTFTSGSRPWFMVRLDSENGGTLTSSWAPARYKSVQSLNGFNVMCDAVVQFVQSLLIPILIKLPGRSAPWNVGVSWNWWRAAAHPATWSSAQGKCHGKCGDMEGDPHILNTVAILKRSETPQYATIWLYFSCFRPVPPKKIHRPRAGPFSYFQNSVQNWKWLLLSASPFSINRESETAIDCDKNKQSYTGTCFGFDRSLSS